MGVDIRVRVKGGGHVSQTYGMFLLVYIMWTDKDVWFFVFFFPSAIRQAISKSLVAYYQKCEFHFPPCNFPFPPPFSYPGFDLPC